MQAISCLFLFVICVTFRVKLKLKLVCKVLLTPKLFGYCGKSCWQFQTLLKLGCFHQSTSMSVCLCVYVSVCLCVCVVVSTWHQKGGSARVKPTSCQWTRRLIHRQLTSLPRYQLSSLCFDLKTWYWLMWWSQLRGSVQRLLTGALQQQQSERVSRNLWKRRHNFVHPFLPSFLPCPSSLPLVFLLSFPFPAAKQQR